MNGGAVGLLAAVLLASALIAGVGAAIALSRYRRAVMRGMERAAGVVTPVPPPVARAPAHRLQIQVLARDAAAAPLAGPGPAARAYAVAGLGYAATMAIAVHASEDFSLSWLAMVFLGWIYAWPTVPAVVLVAALGRGQVLRAIAIYAGAGALLIGLAGAISTSTGALGLVLSWVIFSGLPTLVMGAFLWRNIRAAGPLMLAMAVPAVLGSQLVLWPLADSDVALQTLAGIGHALRAGGVGVLVTTMAVGALFFGAGAWLALRRLGARYERRSFSDEMLMLDALWLVFALAQSVQLATRHLGWLLAGPVAFAVWWLLARRALARVPRAAHPRTLMLLRVFALGPRGARLFDLLRRRWLRGGPIVMIAGPDLAKTAVEPHEFLNFLGRRLDRQFVDDAAGLERRIAQMPRGPDPDARHRVHEFFCRVDTWQLALQRLLPQSDAVLMDLRGFGPERRGCVYEIGRVVDTVPLDRVVFAVDDTTDRPFLQSVFDEAWSSLAAGSPNRSAARPSARLFEILGPDADELEALVGHLSGAAQVPAA